jgi:hypothetical protein
VSFIAWIDTPHRPCKYIARGPTVDPLAAGKVHWARRRWRRTQSAHNRLSASTADRSLLSTAPLVVRQSQSLVGELDLIEQQVISTTSKQQPWGTDVASIERRITVEEGALPTSLPPASAYASTGAQQQSPEPRAFMHSASVSTAPSISAVTGAPRAGTLVMGDTCVPFLSSSEAGETRSGVGERDFDSLASRVTENSGGKRPAWFDVAEARSKVLRVLEEMSEFYSEHRGACDRWLPSVPMGEADTAEDLKQHLMLCQPRWAGEWHVALAKSPSLWCRVQLMKLRHMGQRRLYVVIYSLDLLHRLLVLHVPVGPFDVSHARLQGTYRDDRFGRFECGLRIRDEILELLEPEEREFGMQYRDGGGYPFTHTDLPKPSRRANYRSYDFDHADKSLLDLERQLDRGYLEGPLLYTPRIVHPQGGVYNESKQKYRPVLDATASGLNGTIVPLDCSYVALSDVVKPHTPSCWMSGFDLKDAFLLWPRAQHGCDLQGIRGPPQMANYYRYRFAAMGVSDSPAIQSNWANILQRMLGKHALEPVVQRQRDASPERLAGATACVAGIYVDDAHNVHSSAFTETEAGEQFAAVVGFLEKYGVEDSQAKREAPRHLKDFIGFEVDTTLMMVRVQPKRRVLYRQVAIDFLGSHSLVAPRRELATLLGKLQFCAPVAQGLTVLLAPLYDACSDLRLWAGESDTAWAREVMVPFTNPARTALERVVLLLDDARACERRIYSEPTLPLRYSGFWTGDVPDTCDSLLATSFTSTGIPVYTGDASGDGGGAHHLDKRLVWRYDAQHCAPHESSNWRELNTAVRPMESSWAEDWAGGRVLNMSDNSTTVAVINRHGSMVPKLAAQFERIQTVCDKRRIDLASKHIPGVQNVLADELSRDKRALDDGDYLFDRGEFARLDTLLSRIYGNGGAFHTLDGCCDVAGNNRQVERFCSHVESLLTRSLVGEALWANVDFNAQFTEMALRHFMAAYRASPANTSGTFVLPVWLRASWWRFLKGARVVALYPPGTALFTSPDWTALRRLDGTYGFGTERVDRGPTRWPVLVAHFPSTGCRRVSGGTSATASCRVVTTRLAYTKLPVLRGDAAHDAGVLRGVPSCTLR